MFESQEAAELAAKYVNTTGRHIFLTGKAGTGKTTFLKHIVEHTYKNAVIAAPTGIAAINAGGVTLHSLLQLPFGTFIPENVPFSSDYSQTNTPQSVTRGSRFSVSKRKLIQELELLIIDEVSMLRADLLDCIDHMLRYVRKRKHEPFGGLQMLFIGDLMQLPPVVKDTETTLLRPYYSSLYFFESKALKQTPPILVELQKVFRQTDQQFIDLLNRFRHNEQTTEDIQQLNKHHQPDFDEILSHGYIHLTTHNHRVFQINNTKLQQLENPVHTFQSHVEGNFPENMYPTDVKLELKEGAQVMFIKNDPTGQGRFFNGKIGTVSNLSKQEIWVKDEAGQELLVESYTWENKRYVLDKVTNEINESYLGSFAQYPLKLAWAVTIHKSQGLTFEKAILDLSGTFSQGQLYVALSRLTSLKYLVLSSPLPKKPPGIDHSLKEFTSSFTGTAELENNLEHDQREFLQRFVQNAFDFSMLVHEVTYHQSNFNKDKNQSAKQQYVQWSSELIETTQSLKKTGDQFIHQIGQISSQTDPLPYLDERVSKAKEYFSNELTNISDRVSTHKQAVKKETKVKAYIKELEHLETLVTDQNRQVLKSALLVSKARENKMITKEDLKASGVYKAREKQTSGKDKIPTAQTSYELYAQGKTIAEIAEARNLVVSTIEGHLAGYVENGTLDVHKLMKSDRIRQITEKYTGGFTSSGAIKAELSNDYGYGEIKLVLAYIRSMEASNE